MSFSVQFHIMLLPSFADIWFVSHKSDVFGKKAIVTSGVRLPGRQAGKIRQKAIVKFGNVTVRQKMQ